MRTELNKCFEKKNLGGRKIRILQFLCGLVFYFSFLQNFTHNTFGFWDNTGCQISMICVQNHPVPPCLSCCFPVQYMEKKRFRTQKHRFLTVLCLNFCYRGKNKSRGLFFLQGKAPDRDREPPRFCCKKLFFTFHFV